MIHTLGPPAPRRFILPELIANLGTEITWTPAQRLIVVAIRLLLSTDATVGNRDIRLKLYRDDAEPVWQAGLPAAVAASKGAYWQLAADCALSTTFTSVTAAVLEIQNTPMPALPVDPGATLTIDLDGPAGSLDTILWTAWALPAGDPLPGLS